MNSAKDFFLNSLSVSVGLIIYSIMVYAIYKFTMSESEEEKKKEEEKIDINEEKEDIENFDILEEI